MKVVINKCYGGFGLSPEAERAYLARKGKEAFFYAEDRGSDDKPGERDLVRVTDADARKAFITYTSTKDFGERVKADAFWDKSDDHYFYDRDIDRADPDLAAVVEELADKANGSHAALRVVEIPDGVEYDLDEYDGIESIHERHRSWA